MKRFFTVIFVFFFGTFLFPADIVSFDDLRVKYEMLLSNQSVENLSNFSELLDVFQTGDFFTSVSKKRSSYKEATEKGLVFCGLKKESQIFEEIILKNLAFIFLRIGLFVFFFLFFFQNSDNSFYIGCKDCAGSLYFCCVKTVTH